MALFFDDFNRRIGIDDAGCAVFSDALSRLTGKYGDRLANIRRTYREGDFDIVPTLADREALARDAGMPVETLNYVVLALESEDLHARYQQAGYSEDLFYDTMDDLCYKERECVKVKGCHGIFVEPWYQDFMRLRTFRLGRLEYQKEIFRAPTPYTKHGANYKTGDPIVQLHIPENGPLTRERRFDSYKRAYDFFPEYRKGDVLFALCHSWLLYPDNRQIFDPKSNTVDFMGDFDLFDAEERPKFEDAWRLYGRMYDGHPENLPRETSMQRGMTDWLRSGKHSGMAYGIVAITRDGLLSGEGRKF